MACEETKTVPTAAEGTPLRQAVGLCPECLKPLAAPVFSDEAGTVWMERTCPEHGTVTTRVWNDAKHYEWLRSLAFNPVPPAHTCDSKGPCPTGCGTCHHHKRRGTLYEIETTRACNLHCPVCFMSSDNHDDDPTLDEISAMYDAIAEAVGTDGAVQLTGGEPTCRADLPEIIAMGREKGFWGIEVNTNGLVIAAKPGYVESLVAAGVTGIYLSFDGLTGDVYEVTCGRDILDIKLKAIQRCREAGIQVVLSVAVMAGVNDQQLGDLLRFSLENSDVVAGLALQPAFTSGRFDADDPGLTMGDVIFELAEQSNGVLDPYEVWPLGCSHPLCDTGMFFVRAGEDDESGQPTFVPASRLITFDEYRQAISPDSPQGSVFADILYQRGFPVADGLSVIIMNYMDAYSMDLERMGECSMFVAVPDGGTIPFCSYHLTDQAGHRLYPPWCKR